MATSLSLIGAGKLMIFWLFISSYMFANNLSTFAIKDAVANESFCIELRNALVDLALIIKLTTV